jgi:hypothetical protein
MGRWTESDEERVNPTVRWFFRGVWKLLFVLLLVFLAGVAITLIADSLA